MALGTSSQERIRPVTGTHVVRVQHEGIVTAWCRRGRARRSALAPVTPASRWPTTTR